MTLSLAEKVFMVCGLIDIGGIFVWIGVCLHLAYTKMDLMLEHLKNCSAIMVRAPLRHGGPWGNLLLVGGISGIVTFPGFYLKRGGLSAEDLANFPAPLKRKLAILHGFNIALLLVMVGLAVVVKLGFV